MQTSPRRFLRRGAAVLVALIVASSCSDDSADTTGRESSDDALAASSTSTAAPASSTTTATVAPTTTVTVAPPAIVGSAGCGNEPPALGAETLTLATADGLTRSYRRFIPASLDPADPVPVVLNFHGFSGSADQQVGLTRLEDLAATEGFVVVSPQGTVAESLGETFWNNEPGPPSVDDPTLNVDDVSFVEQLLDQLEADLCVDTARLYSTGISNGGMFSSRLACDLSERLAAVATVAGILHAEECDPTRPIPLVHFHGTADKIVPFEVGPSSLSDEVVTALTSSIRSIPDQVDDWSSEYGCDPDAEVIEVSDEVERREYRGCEGGGAVDFYVVAGGGHTWPGTALPPAFEDLLGYTTLDIDATEIMWDWFERHPLGAVVENQ